MRLKFLYMRHICVNRVVIAYTHCEKQVYTVWSIIPPISTKLTTSSRTLSVLLI